MKNKNKQKKTLKKLSKELVQIKHETKESRQDREREKKIYSLKMFKFDVEANRNK